MTALGTVKSTARLTARCRGRDAILDASAVKNDFFGHSYVGPPFFADLRQVIQGISSPARVSREDEIYRLKKSRTGCALSANNFTTSATTQTNKTSGTT